MIKINFHKGIILGIYQTNIALCVFNLNKTIFLNNIVKHPKFFVLIVQSAKKGSGHESSCHDA